MPDRDEDKTYVLEMSATEGGVLLGLLVRYAYHNPDLQKIIAKLRADRQQLLDEAGVITTELKNGWMQMTDRDGAMLVREKFPWEYPGDDLPSRAVTKQMEEEMESFFKMAGLNTTVRAEPPEELADAFRYRVTYTIPKAGLEEASENARNALRRALGLPAEDE